MASYGLQVRLKGPIVEGRGPAAVHAMADEVLAELADYTAVQALASGYFDSVNGHEPLSPPTSGVTCAVWTEQIGPARGGSGLDSTSARLALFVRLYTPMTQQPADAIDPNLMDALNALFVAY